MINVYYRDYHEMVRLGFFRIYRCKMTSKLMTAKINEKVLKSTVFKIRYYLDNPDA